MRLLLWATRTLTVQRREDQQGTSGNREALARLAALLASGDQVAIFPEGFSHSEGRLRPFKTGAARIALEAAEKSDEVVVVPVGLVYLQKSVFRSDVVVRFGPAIEVSQLPADQREPHALTACFEREVAALAVPISPERSEFVQWVAELVLSDATVPRRIGEPRDNYLPRYVEMLEDISTGYDRLGARRVADVEDRVLRLHTLTGGAQLAASELFLPLSWWRVTIFVVRELEVLLVAGPIALFGFLNHLPAYLVTRAIVARTAKDEDHVATNAVFFGVPCFAICYVAQSALVAALCGLGWVAAYIVSLPYTGAVALLFRDRIFDSRRRLASFFALVSNRSRRDHVQEEARALVSDIKQLMKEMSQ
jgi:glycerol-3-phosphate O-acyltransferase/dihydroxyacetone phosphate acyltransferase